MACIGTDDGATPEALDAAEEVLAPQFRSWLWQRAYTVHSGVMTLLFASFSAFTYFNQRPDNVLLCLAMLAMLLTRLRPMDVAEDRMSLRLHLWYGLLCCLPALAVGMLFATPERADDGLMGSLLWSGLVMATPLIPIAVYSLRPEISRTDPLTLAVRFWYAILCATPLLPMFVHGASPALAREEFLIFRQSPILTSLGFISAGVLHGSQPALLSSRLLCSAAYIFLYTLAWAQCFVLNDHDIAAFTIGWSTSCGGFVCGLALWVAIEKTVIWPLWLAAARHRIAMGELEMMRRESLRVRAALGRSSRGSPPRTLGEDLSRGVGEIDAD
jgi:hypothetical protein